QKNRRTFDQNLPNNEDYKRLNITRFEANYGLYYRHLDRSKKAHPFAGFAMSHLTRPNESFTGGETRMPIKFVGYGGIDIKIDDKTDITPRAMYMNQAKAHEFMLGMLLYYRINDDDVK